MPGRLVPLVTDQFYHVFNRGIDHRTTFTNANEFKRAITTLEFYSFSTPPLKLSRFLKLSKEEREKLHERLKTENNKLVEILSFCLMPNHFHFLLKQLQENGISKFLSIFQNSYTRYFNTKNDRDGSLFLDQFKAVLIETDEQLLHVSRYIHLNPLTSYIVKDFDSLSKYLWSSLSEYLNQAPEICKLTTVLDFFNSTKEYLKFIEDQVEYQRELHKIRHLLLE